MQRKVRCKYRDLRCECLSLRYKYDVIGFGLTEPSDAQVGIGFGLTEPSDAQVGIGFGLRTRT